MSRDLNKMALGESVGRELMLEEGARLGTMSAGAHVCGLFPGSGALRLTAAYERVEGGNQVVYLTKISTRRFCRDFIALEK